MRNISFGWLVLASASLGFAQHSLTITASRSTAWQPDQAVFAVSVNSGQTAGLDDIVAALQGSGLTAADLSSVRTQTMYVGSQVQQGLQWVFRLPVSFAQMKDTVAALTGVQKKTGQKGNGLSMAFSLQGVQASPQLLQSQQCPIPDLLADARVQAQKLADAGGFFLGPVTAMSTGGLSAPLGQAVFGPFPIVNLTPVSNYCSLVVQFGLN